MKAEIAKDGHLTLMPESEVEEFALKLWWADFSEHSRCDGSGKYTISIITYEQSKERKIQLGHKDILEPTI